MMMRKILGLPLMMLAAVGAESAIANCDVMLDRMLGNNQIVLKADCGAGVTQIQWYKGATPLSNATVSATTTSTTYNGAPFYLVTPLPTGTTTYSATANTGAIAAGNVATITAAGLPVIGKVPDQTLTQGSTYNFSLAPYVLTSSGPLTYSVNAATPLPTGLTLNTATGAISGAPTTIGSFGVNWTVADNNGTAAPPGLITYTVIVGTPPTAPTSVVATAGNAQISVAFSGQTQGSGSSPSYVANCGGITQTGTSPIVVTGLTNGTAYTCTVQITNTAGTATSAASNSATPSAPTGPTAPTSVIATAGNAQISVAFSGQTLGSGTLTNYTANCGGITATGSSSPITVTNLTNNTPYTCTVTVTTSVTPPATSTASNSVTPSAGTPPTAPTSVIATAGNAQISVAFSGQTLGSGTLTNYTANCGGITATGSSSPITVTNLTNNTPYTCTVTVSTTYGSPATSSPSNSVTPTAPTSGCGTMPSNFVLLHSGDSAYNGTWKNQSGYGYIAQLPAGLGVALEVTATKSMYPNGFIITDGTGGTKKYVVSACPGSNTPVANIGCTQNNNAVAWTGTGDSSTCIAPAPTGAEKYYVNITNTGGGAVGVQYTNYAF